MGKIVLERRSPTWNESDLKNKRAKELIEEWRAQGRPYADGLQPLLLKLEQCLVRSGDLR